MKNIISLLSLILILFAVPAQAQLGKLFKKKKPAVTEKPKPKKKKIKTPLSHTTK